MSNGILYIVATPIGNLGDITLRALETLKSVDFILCEDTRHTQKILNHFEIKTPTISYHQHSDERKLRKIKEILEDGKSLALVTDAGTPGISDPGNRLVQHVVIPTETRGAGRVEGSLSEPRIGIPRLSALGRIARNDIVVIPIPGPSAVIAALSVSGFPTDKFIFLGFPPHKGRARFFKEVAEAQHTVAFYESNHRIKKCLNELKETLCRDAKSCVSRVCVCRELTKQFETIYRGTIEEILEMKILEKGEFVIIINK